MTERNFISQVYKKLIDPRFFMYSRNAFLTITSIELLFVCSVFICFNRWDCVDNADCDTDQKDGVKQQHFDSAIELLLQEVHLETDIVAQRFG